MLKTEGSISTAQPLLPRVGRLWVMLVVVVLALGLVGRVAYSLSKPTSGEALDQSLAELPDQREYLQSAQSLIERGELSFVDPRFSTLVHAFRMPGYPALIAALGADVMWLRFAQAVMDTASAALAGAIAWRLTRSRVALLASVVLVAFNPYLIYFSALILTETATAFLLVAGVWALVAGLPPNLRMEHGRTAIGLRVTWWLGVVLLIAAIFFRPSLIALPLIMAVGSCLFIDRPGVVVGRRVPVSLLVGVLTLAALLPWAFRNRAVVGEWVFTTTNTGFTWYDGFNPNATGASDQRFTQSMPELAIMNETRRSTYLTSRAWEWARGNPGRVLELTGIKAARTFSPVPLSVQFGQNRVYFAAGLVFALPVFVLALSGLWRGKVRPGVKLFLLMPVLYLGLAHAATVGSLRYRMPVEPMMAILASFGAAALVRPSEAKATLS